MSLMGQDAKIFNLGAFRSKQLIEDGKHFISEGDLDRAVDAFQKSLDVLENAEALTYKAWVLNLKEQD